MLIDFLSPLLASLFVYWDSPATANSTVEALPLYVVEDSFLLPVHNLPATVWDFYWYKGKNVIERNENEGFLKPQRRNETRPA